MSKGNKDINWEKDGRKPSKQVEANMRLPLRTEFEVLGMREMLNTARLSDDEARELCRRAQAGDAEAQELLCGSFSKLAMMLSKAFGVMVKSSVVDVEDLFSTAMMDGIRFGILKYNPDLEVPFHNWVALCIRLRLRGLIQTERRHIRLRAENVKKITEEWYGLEAQHNVVEQEQQLELEELQHLAREALESGAMSEVEAQALMLRSQGIVYTDVAKRMGLHRNTVMRYVGNATELLRTMVEAEL